MHIDSNAGRSDRASCHQWRHGFARMLMLSGLLCGALFAATFSGSAAGLSSADRDRGRTMLKLLKADLEKYYYDAEFRGMKLDERFKQAEGRIA